MHPNPPALTISRCLGSSGRQVGLNVAKELRWQFCDRRILREAAKSLGKRTSNLDWQEERYSGFLDQLAAILAWSALDAPYAPFMDLPVYSRDLYARERDVMLRMAQRAPSVFIGRGSFFALKDRPNAFHVSLVVSDLPFRIQNVLDLKLAPNPQAARKAIEKSDRDRGAFIRDISGLDWLDPKNFDLTLDVAKEGIQGCTDRLVAEARKRFQLNPGSAMG